MGIIGAATLVTAGALALFGAPAMAAPPRWAPPPTPYTCTGGDFATGNITSIPSGIYSNIDIRGACAVAPNAVIDVIGNVNVGNVNVGFGAVFDAQDAPSTITVGNDVTAAPGSLLGLGCLPDPVGHMTGHPCTVDPTGSSDITVNGNVTAVRANTVLLNGITVRGNVTLIGGGE